MVEIEYESINHLLHKDDRIRQLEDRVALDLIPLQSILHSHLLATQDRNRRAGRSKNERWLSKSKGCTARTDTLCLR